MLFLISILVIATIQAETTADKKFYDHGEFEDTDYNMFDTFEPYTWHKYQHSVHSKKQNMRAFYLKEQVQKEFAELLNITFDIDII